MAFDERVRTVGELTTARPSVVVAVNAIMLAVTAAAGIAGLTLARGSRGFFAIALAVIASASVYAWAVDGIEYWRHMLPGFAVLAPLAITLASGTRSSSPRDGIAGTRESPTMTGPTPRSRRSATR